MIKLDNNNRSELLIISSNLKSICIHTCDVEFDDFEMLIKTISSDLKSLRINVNQNESYFNGDRWKRLITNYMINLHNFDFKYTLDINQLTTKIKLNTSINQFTSSFWIERGWYLEIKIIDNSIIFCISRSRYTEKICCIMKFHFFFLLEKRGLIFKII